MSFKRFLYLLEQAPRLWALLREVWVIFKHSPENEIQAYIADMDHVIMRLKDAKSKDEKLKLARDISIHLSRLR